MEEPDRHQNEHPRISGTELFLLSLGSALLYAFIAWIIFYYFHEDSPLEIIFAGLPVVQQIGVGVGFGCLAAAGVGFITYQPPVSGILRDFAIIDFVSNTRFTFFDRVQVSVFAGVGEEFLFRGAIQPLLGVWWTSVIFVALHGYFHFKSTGHIIFGLMMFSLSVGLGFLFEWAGLIAAMVAHTVYDFVLLQAVHIWGLPDTTKLPDNQNYDNHEL